MRIVVVTKARARPGARAPERVIPERLKKLLPDLGPNDLLYLDLASLPVGFAQVRLRRLLGPGGPLVGVIDPRGTVKDVPALFHAGVVDYLDRAAWRRGLTPKRLATVFAYSRTLKRCPEPETPGESAMTAWRPSGRDWTAVRSGEEYTFSVLFVELDGADGFERRYGAADLAAALASFRAYVERSVAPSGGRIWIWSRFGGIVLFPFDGKSERAAACALRMALFKPLYDIEESHFPHFISYRMAAHLGDVVWRERQTGTILSDALNTAFHLGQTFTPPGRCCVTEEVHRLAPPALQAFYRPAGEFEGRRIWRLRRPREP